MKVVIVGAGLIGLTSAYRLAQRGAEVVLVERAVVGSGASRGNAGEICPDQATPVAKASLILSAVSQLYRRDSALHVSAGTLPGYLPFLLRIARNSLPGRYASNQAALAQVETLATHAFLDLADEVGVEVSNNGYLYVYATEQAAKEGRKAELRRMAHSQLPHDVTEVLDSSGLREIEPSLGSHGYGFLDAGSFFTNPVKYVETLHRKVTELGVTICEGTTATAVTEHGGQQVLHTNTGEVRGDAVVMTAGVGSAEIAAASGYRLPLKAGKGYSFAVDLECEPSHVFKFDSAHVAGLPLGGNTLRIAGTMEFDGDRDRFNAERIDQIVAALSPYLPAGALAVRRNEWVGARPMLPDGRPVIDKVPGLSQTYMASGHNMLGLMLAPFTAGLVSDMVLGHRSTQFQQFSASRAF